LIRPGACGYTSGGINSDGIGGACGFATVSSAAACVACVCWALVTSWHIDRRTAKRASIWTTAKFKFACQFIEIELVWISLGTTLDMGGIDLSRLRLGLIY
jgi:hypothetical protein